MKTADELLDALRSALETGDADEIKESVSRISSFAESGVLTRDLGLRVRMESGATFDITITES